MRDPGYDWSKDPNHPFIKYAAMVLVVLSFAAIVIGAAATVKALT